MSATSRQYGPVDLRNGNLTTPQLAERVGVSVRMIDHCYRHGALRPIGGKGGSGSTLEWPPHEVTVVEICAAVAAAMSGWPFSQVVTHFAPTFRVALLAGESTVTLRKYRITVSLDLSVQP